MTLTGTNIANPRRPRSNFSEGVLHIPQTSRTGDTIKCTKESYLELSFFNGHTSLQGIQSWTVVPLCRGFI